MANRTGAKWTKGGKHKRNTLRVDLSGLENLITRLDSVGGNVKAAVDDALLQAAETVQDDTKDALAKQNLPHQGVYSLDRTIKTIAEPQVIWNGSRASAGIGFDYAKNGAGGLLISGTPSMQPDRALEDIYTRKKYAKQLVEDMQDVIGDYIVEAMEGK